MITKDDFLNVNLSIPTDDFIDRLRDFPSFWREPDDDEIMIPDQSLRWIGIYEVNLTEILWSTGFCYTFNYPGFEKMFNDM